MLAHASRSTPKRSACPRGENAATAARPVWARRIVSSTAHLARHQRNQNCRRHGARKVETRALLPMAGTSYALAVALHASKAKPWNDQIALGSVRDSPAYAAWPRFMI